MTALLWCLVVYAVLHCARFTADLRAGQVATLRFGLVVLGLWAAVLLVA